MTSDKREFLKHFGASAAITAATLGGGVGGAMAGEALGHACEPDYVTQAAEQYIKDHPRDSDTSLPLYRQRRTEVSIVIRQDKDEYGNPLPLSGRDWLPGEEEAAALRAWVAGEKAKQQPGNETAFGMGGAAVGAAATLFASGVCIDRLAGRRRRETGEKKPGNGEQPRSR